MVDSPEFRDLLLFCGDKLLDKDIPHQDHLSWLVMTDFKTSWDALVSELGVCAVPFQLFLANLLQSAAGKVSFTADMWTSTTQVVFMVVTAHFIVHEGTYSDMRARLVAF